MNAIQKLRSLHTEITTSNNGLKIVDAWTLAERLLLRASNDLDTIQRVIAEKDAEGLDALISALENPTQPPAPTGPEIPEAQKDAALRAFKKRIKLQRLADESRLGGRYTSGGRTSKIDAILPPKDFDDATWKALARDGHLIDTGGGFYALAEAHKPKPNPRTDP